ncbi:MAG: hypothetical protein BRD55_08510 [Bacteroidetes bacterium SW_9_63_38]|nr:MAG: hypothetical protein BRD55_08510 [Bacteroidetes bacterium SW_9_63_38]
MTAPAVRVIALFLLAGALMACDSGGSMNDSDDQTSDDQTNTSPAFALEVRFLDDFTSDQKSNIRNALVPWNQAITEDLESVSVSQIPPDCELDKADVDDVLLVIRKADLDGSGGRLAQAKPCVGRTDAEGNVKTAALSLIEIDKADLGNTALEEIVTHEIGHALGIGVSEFQGWGENVSGLNTPNPSHSGANTTSAFDNLEDEAYLSSGVPVANTGGQGTAGAHWREVNLKTELMTGFIDNSKNSPLSRVSLAALADIGYSVDLSTADSYSLPMPQETTLLAEADATLSRPASSGKNFGAPDDGSLGETLVAGNNANGRWSSDSDTEKFSGLVRFDVPSSLPSGVTIKNATLRLVVNDRVTDDLNHSIQISPVTGNWTEDNVTWGNKPSSGSTVDSYDYETCDQCKRDLTDLTTDWLTGMEANHGVVVKAKDPSYSSMTNAFSVGYYSRHMNNSSASQRPIITVTAESGSSSLTEKSKSPGEKIPLGDDIRDGMIYGVDAHGTVVSKKRLQ